MLDRVLDLYREPCDAPWSWSRTRRSQDVRRHVRRASQARAYRVASAAVRRPACSTRSCWRIAGGRASRPSVWITWCDQVAVHPRPSTGSASARRRRHMPPLVMPTVMRDAARTSISSAMRRTRSSACCTGVKGTRCPTTRGERHGTVRAVARRRSSDRLPAYAATVEVGPGDGRAQLLPFIPWLAAQARRS